ncbi:MAG: DUF1684 domain-containing protein [Polaribacter sp.]|jgi:uncharacterized protein (DUF1684 family)|nr:DUF1684 domain-containing protein [Polaribacter sp.]
MRKPFLCVLALLIFNSCSSKKRPILGETVFQIRLNTNYKDASISPLKKKDLKKFNGLAFFPIDSSFIVKAKFTKIKNALSFKMPTNTDRKILYKEYGILRFPLKGKNHELTIYQSQDDLRDENYKDYLFLPFTDATSGSKSYGGGRYMDIKTTDINKDNTVLLNFNNTSNPYCAYNDKYSCPLTPRKNHLDLEVKAGIMAFNNP